MNCKKTQRILLDRKEDNVSNHVREMAEDHLRGCSDCGRFEREIVELRQWLDEDPGPCLPQSLDMATLRRCRQILTPRSPLSRIPKPIWAALFALTLLTVVFVAPVISDAATTGRLFALSGSPHWIFLIIQNALMLFFSPLLIRRLRGSQINNSLEEYIQ